MLQQDPCIRCSNRWAGKGPGVGGWTAEEAQKPAPSEAGYGLQRRRLCTSRYLVEDLGVLNHIHFIALGRVWYVGKFWSVAALPQVLWCP